ncbi:MAG TPA: hypothetical protein PKE27_08125 [Povalibacter sp.]|uniref:hypothetical protein n=1 Tax=Povalibacter sp. TaxID=1962978 RepID=UPI002C4F4F2B|nr:hypothetical protein [Povalibacter sp.]HMN44523.1 hypothetical protein [Povalibacter sp.]
MNRSATIWAVILVVAGARCGAAEVALDAERIAQALKNWEALEAASYTYDLGIGIGAPFGYGEFHVKVRDGKCSARHYGGIGFGRPKLMNRLRYQPCREGYLPRELMEQIAGEVSNGRKLVELKIHPKYAFAVGASTDTDKLYDASWSFEIREFKLQDRR